MGLIGTLQDLLHARIVGMDGAPSPVTGPDDRHGVVAPRSVDSDPLAVDRADSWAGVIERMSANAAHVERVCDVIHAINAALDGLDQAYARREHGGVAQSLCVDQIRHILIDAHYRL